MAEIKSNKNKSFQLQQIPLPVKLKTDTTFQNFIVGKNNTAVAYLQNPSEQFIFLWGQTGVGKTHLLQACCHAAELSFYLPGREYENYSPQMLQNLEALKIICIDDLQLFAGNKAWEEAIFHLYNRCLTTGTRMVFSAAIPAQEIPLQLKDLQSRLIAAVASFIEDLSDLEKIQALQNYSAAREMELPNEVAQFLVTRCDRSLKNLIDLLDKLDQASLSAQRKLTVPFVKIVLDM